MSYQEYPCCDCGRIVINKGTFIREELLTYMLCANCVTKDPDDKSFDPDKDEYLYECYKCGVSILSSRWHPPEIVKIIMCLTCRTNEITLH